MTTQYILILVAIMTINQAVVAFRIGTLPLVMMLIAVFTALAFIVKSTNVLLKDDNKTD